MTRARFGKTVARSMLIGGLALLAVPAVAGCEAGETAPTLEFHQAAGGAYDMSTAIHVSNAFVLGAPSGSSVPAGGSASLFLGLYNAGSAQDKLQSATADTLTPGGQPGAPLASSVEIKGGSVALPPGQSANLTGPEPSVVLKGLKQPLHNGETVLVTLNFQGVGQVALKTPVEAQSDYYSTYSPPPAAAASASPSASGKAGKAGAKASSSASGKASPSASPRTSPAASASPSPTATK